MNPEVKKLWVDRLRSGVPQGTSRLRTEKGFCCLGVLCELAVEAGVIPEPERSENPLRSHVIWYYDGEPAVLPDSVVAWAELPDSCPSVVSDFACRIDPDVFGDVTSLAFFNDNGKTFDEIADIIETCDFVKMRVAE